MKKDLESSSESSEEEEEEEEEVLTKEKKEDGGSKAKPKLARSSTKSKLTRPSKGHRPDRGSARSARKK